MIILLLALSGISLHYIYGYSGVEASCRAFATDDAYITFRYAQNFWKGNGIYFNKGQRVEGYSNFLYLVLMIPGIILCKGSMYFYSTLINTIILFWIMYIFYKILLIRLPQDQAFLGPLLIAVSPAIWANVSTGLESILVLAVFVYFFYKIKESEATDKEVSFTAVATVSMLARIDGFLLPLIVSAYLILNKKKKSGIFLALYTISFMIIYGIIRIYYYDDIIANTYYAKVSGNLSWRILLGVLYVYFQTIHNGIFFFSIFTVAMIVINVKKNEKPDLRIRFEFLFPVLWIPYLIYVGGDIFFERFLLPLLIIGIYSFISYISEKVRTIQRIALFLAIAIGFSVFIADKRFAYQEKTYDMWVNLGKFMIDVPKDFVLAIEAAGKVPFYSELKTIDMLGLNNKYIGKMKIKDKSFMIGHSKYDADYILSLKPHLISSWIYSSEDMQWGLKKEKYQAKYKLKYLINVTRINKGTNIYDVESYSKKLIKKLILEKFRYGVLVRKDSLDAVPSLATTPQLLSINQQKKQ